MDKKQLYVVTLKMLKDKYDINEYPLQKFNNIYDFIYNNHNTKVPDNNINKQILIHIKNEIENKQDDKFNIEMKLKEIELIRSTLKEETERKLKEPNPPSSIPITVPSGVPAAIPGGVPSGVPMGTGNISIIRMNDNKNDVYKTFVVHVNRNEIHITNNRDINNKNNNIYPCCICVSNSFLQIKRSPYITLIIKDDIKKIEYSFIRENETTFRPVIDNYNYMDVGINNQWIISLSDFCGNRININEYYYEIIDVLELEEAFSLNINKELFNNFDINDDIRIISETKVISSNVINKNDNNNRIIINKKDLKLEDFKYAKIFNCKYQISVFFKYNLKS